MTPTGKSILQSLTEYRVRKWFTAEWPVFVSKLIKTVQESNEVVSGGVVAAGATISASALGIDLTALVAKLKGRLVGVAAQTDVDLFTTAGVRAQAIYTDGSTAAAISLGSNETAYVSLILCNTDGAGGANEDDNDTVYLLAVVHGTATDFETKTDFATSVQIQAALEASTGVHAGVTGWTHLAAILWDENGGAPTATVTLNRNNVILNS